MDHFSTTCELMFLEIRMTCTKEIMVMLCVCYCELNSTGVFIFVLTGVISVAPPLQTLFVSLMFQTKFKPTRILLLTGSLLSPAGSGI